MSGDREAILGRVRAALGPLSQRVALPDYDGKMAVMRQVLAGRDLVELFGERLRRVNGRMFTDGAALAEVLRAGGWMRGYCDPVLREQMAAALGADFTLETVFDRTRVDDYAFGITRAAGAVAESGTIILDDTTTSRRLGALAPWVHIAVVERATVLGDLAQAIGTLGADRNVIWCTGPSKTADVEGILIEGVHGPGQQFALVV